MLTLKTIQKVFEIANAMFAKYSAMDIDNINMCLSKGNSKIGRVLNVSTMPGRNCKNCKNCLPYCYDMNACVRYPDTVIDARIRNSVILYRDRDEFFRRIDVAMSRRRKNKFFRWHVAGDIMDLDYFDRMISNAKKHPDFIIWTYTKMYDIVNAWIDKNGSLPANFHVMFSKWDGVPMNNPYNMPMFTCKLKAGNKDFNDSFFDGMYNCPGNCDICKKMHRGCIAGENTWIDEH